MPVDSKGYVRTHKDKLFHRQVAYHEIYLPKRHKYPLPFGKYVVHHIDKDKWNNVASNLEILTPEEHATRHPEHNSRVAVVAG